jgi:transposase-like protein
MGSVANCSVTILLCVRWYVAYSLSLRNLEEMMAERGISVDNTTIYRWTMGFVANPAAGQATAG